MFSKAGADILVCGTSSIFNPQFTIDQGVKKLKEKVKEQFYEKRI